MCGSGCAFDAQDRVTREGRCGSGCALEAQDFVTREWGKTLTSTLRTLWFLKLCGCANMLATITCEQGALFLNQRFDANPKDIQRLFNLLEEHRSILDKAAVQTLREEGNAFVEKRFFGQAKERMSSWSTPSGR